MDRCTLRGPSIRNVLLRIALAVGIAWLPDAVAGAQRGGTLVIGTPTPVITLNPAFARAPMTNFANYQIFETLVTLGPRGEIVPLLAESWRIADDRRTWTFQLRRGVSFHDGGPLTAQAFKAALDRARQDPKTATAAALKEVERLEAVDSHTLRMLTKAPHSSLLYDLTHGATSVMSPDSIAKWGWEEVGLHPAGTGPFKLAEWVKGERLVLVANEAYWGGRPALDRVILRPFPDPTSRGFALETGEVDFIFDPPTTDLERLRSRKGIKISVAPINRVHAIRLDVRQKPFDDVRVRRALNYAVDRQAIASGITRGADAPADSVLPSVTKGYLPSWKYPYDVEKARALLRQAGIGGGFRATLYATNEMFPHDWEMSQAVQSQLRSIGITVDLVAADSRTWVSTMADWTRSPEKARAALAYYAMGPQTNEAGYTISLQLASTGWLNVGHYTNPRVDQLLTDLERTFDPAGQERMLREIQSILADDAPWLLLLSQNQVHAMKDTVEGFSPLPVTHFPVLPMWKR